MSVLTCERCGTTAPLQFVACPKCHALFHAAKLTELASQADTLEGQGDVLGALERLRAMEPMLPPTSKQALELHARITALEPRAAKLPGAPSKAPKWLAGLGAVGLALWKFLGPLLVLLSKGKLLLFGLLKLPTLLSFLVSAALWRDSSSGVGLALVVLGSIYVHEMGHTWAFRRYGIAVSAPMFVPGFGAFVRGTHYPKSAQAAGDVALSGPVWGGVSGVVTLGLGLVLGQPWLCGAALIIAEVNLFNLFPVWQLDGSRATQSLSKQHVLTLAAIGLLGGALAGSPMSLLAGAGLLVRRWVRPPGGEGDRRTFFVFLGLFVGLLVLRFAAQQLIPSR